MYICTHMRMHICPLEAALQASPATADAVQCKTLGLVGFDAADSKDRGLGMSVFEKVVLHGHPEVD